MLTISQMQKQVYRQIHEIAQPGDILFRVIHRETWDMPSELGLERLAMGFPTSDKSDWHTMIYAGVGKESKVKVFDAYDDSVQRMHLQPSFFSNIFHDGCGYINNRLEIARVDGVDDAMRDALMGFCQANLGRLFDPKVLEGSWMTYLLGLPNMSDNPEAFSCQELVIEAYEHAGIRFRHPLERFAPGNPAIMRGYPLGHPPGGERGMFSYMHDRDIYLSPNVDIIAAITQDGMGADGTFKIVEKPDKYSWSPELQKTYGIR
jgi:hypothetical protein